MKTAPRVVKTSLISSKKVKTHAALQKKQAQKSMKAAREAKWATIHSAQTAKQSAKTAKATGRGLKAMAEAAAHAVKAAFAALMAGGGAVFVVLIVIGPVMRTLSYFYSWGQRKQIRELFCTEYFLMQPVSRNRSFTVTYHFIIDEQDAAGVYYLPLLTDISGWISPKKKAGKWKMLSFADGRTFEVSEHEAEAAKEMLSYASNRLYAQKITGENWSNKNNMPGTEETWNPLISPATTMYQKLVKIFLGLMVILFMMSYQILK